MPLIRSFLFCLTRSADAFRIVLPLMVQSHLNTQAKLGLKPQTARVPLMKPPFGENLVDTCTFRKSLRPIRRRSVQG